MVSTSLVYVSEKHLIGTITNVRIFQKVKYCNSILNITHMDRERSNKSANASIVKKKMSQALDY